MRKNKEVKIETEVYCYFSSSSINNLWLRLTYLDTTILTGDILKTKCTHELINEAVRDNSGNWRQPTPNELSHFRNGLHYPIPANNEEDFLENRF